MRYLSLFSGIEAASVAWAHLGWEPVAFCEIDRFPSEVLAYHYPTVPNLGDITKVDWGAFVEQYGAVDIIVGGSPCQSFSIAAGDKRTSLGGESALMFEYIRAIKAVQPKWIIWENVPAVLNTKDDAFGCLLRALQENGYCDLSWRVLDAQYFGVAQRRRRVFLVGYLASAGFRSAAVLFDTESVRGVDKTNRDKRKELAAESKREVAYCMQSGFLGYNGPPGTMEQSNTLTASGSGAPVVCIVNDTAKGAIDVDMCGTLLAGGGSPPLIVQAL